LPGNYPNIKFDINGVCNFCHEHKDKNYLGAEALKKEILQHRSVNKKSKYDCAIGFSGGRDSSFLLYFLTQTLGLNVLAITVDHGYLPPETRQNIIDIAKHLNVDLVIKKHNYLETSFPHHMKSWLKKPTPAMVPVLCVGCRIGIDKFLYEAMKEKQISVYIGGGTPFEENQYKSNLLRLKPHLNSNVSLILGYLKNILINPHYLSNINSVILEAKEFVSVYRKYYLKKMVKEQISLVSPFIKYIRWQEKEINYVLNEVLPWKYNKDVKSSWRGDCDIALIKSFLYIKLLGFNDKDDLFSELIRDNQISREEAIARLTDEHYVSESAIENTLLKAKVNYTSFLKTLNIVRKNCD
jgi:hypothetical protein